MAANTGKGQRTALIALVKSPAFLQGYHDVKNSVHHRYDAAPTRAGQAAYERGRLFAYVFDGDVVFQSGRVNPQALINLKRAVQLKHII